MDGDFLFCEGAYNTLFFFFSRTSFFECVCVPVFLTHLVGISHHLFEFILIEVLVILVVLVTLFVYLIVLTLATLFAGGGEEPRLR